MFVMETVPPDVFCECEPMTRTTYTMPVHNGATWEVCERCGAFVEQNPPASRDGGDAKGAAVADTDDREPDARESCPYCMGSGWYHECGEDSCCCADPDDPCGPYAFDCEECDGLGELPIYDMPPPASFDGDTKGDNEGGPRG